MSLSLRYKAAPDVQVFHRPLVWSGKEDVVWHNIVVAKGWHNRYHIVVYSSAILIRHTKHFTKLFDQELVLAYDLLLRACVFLIVVVSCRVTRPDHKIDLVLDIVVDPSERLIDQRERRVATRRLSAVDACWSSFSMTCCLSCGARVRLIKWVRVEV